MCAYDPPCPSVGEFDRSVYRSRELFVSANLTLERKKERKPLPNEKQYGDEPNCYQHHDKSFGQCTSHGCVSVIIGRRLIERAAFRVSNEVFDEKEGEGDDNNWLFGLIRC